MIYIVRCTIILCATKKGKTNYNRKTHESQMEKFWGEGSQN